MSILEQQQIPTGTWQLDAVHSKVTWSVKHSGIATFRGSFAGFTAELADGVLEGTLDLTSVEVPVEQLKGHLSSPDFFDVEQHPAATFRSHELTIDGEQLSLTGELTLRGVTQPITATGTVAGPAQYLDGKDRIAVELTTTIDRTAYGINWNAPLPGGGQALGNDVTIAVDLQLVKA
jgi:polyisoprenoid-binding protein YceI